MALDQDLTVGRDPDRTARDRPAHGADLLRVGGVGVGRGAGLGQAVAFQDVDAAPAEEVPELRAERRGRAPGVLHLTPERRAQFGVDEPAEQGVLQAQRERGTAVPQRTAVGDGGGLGPGEDPAVALGGGLAPGAVVSLLPQPRHRQHGRRLERRQFGDGVGHVGQAQDGARVDGTVLDELGVAMRQRQEQQCRVVFAEHPLEPVVEHAVADVGHDVAVAEHAALRPAGRAGGVDDLREVAGAPAPAPFFDLLWRHLHAAGHDLGQAAAAVDLPHVGQCGQAGPHRGDHLGVLVGLHHGGSRTGVTQDPLDLLERGSGVDRDGDGAGGQDRVVQQRPFEPGTRHQRHPVTRLDAGGDQASGHVADLPGELTPGHRHPDAAHLAFETDLIGPVLLMREGVIRDIVTGTDNVCHGHRELLHRCPLR